MYHSWLPLKDNSWGELLKQRPSTNKAPNIYSLTLYRINLLDPWSIALSSFISNHGAQNKGQGKKCYFPKGSFLFPGNKIVEGKFLPRIFCFP